MAASSTAPPLPSSCAAAPEDSSVGMSIITRSGLFGRDHLFGPFRDSVLQQNFPRLHHLIATQSTECRYLPPWREEPTPHPCGLRTTIVQSRNISARVFSNPLTTKNLKTCPYLSLIHI